MVLTTNHSGLINGVVTARLRTNATGWSSVKGRHAFGIFWTTQFRTRIVIACKYNSKCTFFCIRTSKRILIKNTFFKIDLKFYAKIQLILGPYIENTSINNSSPFLFKAGCFCCCLRVPKSEREHSEQLFTLLPASPLFKVRFPLLHRSKKKVVCIFHYSWQYSSLPIHFTCKRFLFAC